MDKNPVPTPEPEHERRKVFELTMEDWLERTEQIPLKDVPYWICFTISRYFAKESWRELASKLYVNHQPTYFDLQQIEGDADAHKEWPSLIFLIQCWTESNLSFSAVLTVLYKKLGYRQCLQRLYDEGYVAEFLNWREKHMQDNIEFCTKYGNKFNVEKRLKKATLKETLQLIETLKLTLKKNSTNKDVHVQVSNQILLQSSQQKSYTDHESKSSILKAYQCLNSLRKVVILLTYSADVNDNIPNLVQTFWDAGIGVVAEFVLKGKGYFETNPRDSWENFFKQCNFVVPVISSQYLKDIQDPSNSEQARWVRFIYDLYTRKYVTDGCLNNIVRPLVMDDVRGKYLQKVNPTLAWRWRLDELKDFVDMLKSPCYR